MKHLVVTSPACGINDLNHTKSFCEKSDSVAKTDLFPLNALNKNS